MKENENLQNLQEVSQEFSEEIKKMSEEFKSLSKEVQILKNQMGRRGSSPRSGGGRTDSFIGSAANAMIGAFSSSLKKNGTAAAFNLSGKDMNYLSNFASKLVSNKILGARQNGGMVANGGAYLVGEKGPEIFRPQNSGEIIPNASSSSSGGGNVNVTMNVTTSDAHSFAQSKGQIMAEITAAMRSNRML